MIEEQQNTMLSRVADSLYWMSRYLERAEHTARLIDVNIQLRLDQSVESEVANWLRLTEALQVPIVTEFLPDPARIAETLALDRSNSSSIVSCIAAARENLRHVREQCSSEMWEQLNRFYLDVRSTTPEEASILHSHSLFRAVQDGASLFHGITDSTMIHGEGWHYIQLGRYVERIDNLASFIGTHFKRLPERLDQAVESEEYLDWVGLLKSCSAFEAYCKTYSAELRPMRVAEFLLLNADFPHSVRFSVGRVHGALGLVSELTDRKADAAVRLIGKMRAALSFSQIEEIMLGNPQEYMKGIRKECQQAHAALHEVYFDYPIETAMAS